MVHVSVGVGYGALGRVHPPSLHGRAASRVAGTALLVSVDNGVDTLVDEPTVFSIESPRGSIAVLGCQRGVLRVALIQAYIPTDHQREAKRDDELHVGKRGGGGGAWFVRERNDNDDDDDKTHLHVREEVHQGQQDGCNNKYQQQSLGGGAKGIAYGVRGGHPVTKLQTQLPSSLCGLSGGSCGGNLPA